MEQLTFNQREMTAIIKVALAMSVADGTCENNESSFMAQEAHRFNITGDDLNMLLEGCKNMDGQTAVAELATMTDAQKRYVTAYLGTLMAVDGEISEKELSLWRLMTELCKLPSMSISDAINYMAN